MSSVPTKLQGRKISAGVVWGEALVTSMGISFFGGVDPESGLIVERGHELESQSIAGKILVFPTGKGSTVGSYTMYRLKLNGKAPLAIVNAECETITAVGCIIAEIPCVDHIPIAMIKTGQLLVVDGEAGTVEHIQEGRLSKLTTHRLPIPEPLRGNQPGSFAEKTISVRLPNIVRRVLEDGDWSSETMVALQALIDSMPLGRIRPLQDDNAPDAGDWERYLTPYIGQTWLQIPWFFAESYFFRRILEATGYFQLGADHGIDPYTTLKRQGMAATPDGLYPLCTQLESQCAASRSSREKARVAFTHLLHMAIWGNQADLSMWWSAEHEHPTRPEAGRQGEYLLDDDAAQACDYVFSLTEKPLRMDFILDNGGLELGYDLALADLLLGSGLVQTIWFHVKPYPTYVSDVTVQDVQDTVDFLGAVRDSCIRSLSHRVQSYLSGHILRMKYDYFWTSPLSGWEMPPALRQDLSRSNLIISKGDANYRRWLGDRCWPFTTPKEQALAYLPAPLVALRVLKSEVVIGLQSHQPEELYQKDPRWLFDGRYGVIQFIA